MNHSSLPDVLVCGGGVMGMTAAWRLAARGAVVELLELGRTGQGASQAALGALWPPAPTGSGQLQQLHRQSLWGYRDFLDELSAGSGLRAPYLRQGKLELYTSQRAVDQARLQVQAACRQWPTANAAGDAGTPVMEMLPPAAVAALEPQVAAGAAEGQLCRWSAQVDVDVLLRALREACIRSGVRMSEYSPVSRLESEGSTIRGLISGNNCKKAGKYLLCTGVWTHLLGEPAAAAAIVPVKGQALLLRTKSPLLHHIVKRDRIFLVPWPDGRILVGSTTEPEAGFDQRNTPDGVNFLRQGAAGICPALAEAKVENIWAGLRPSGPKHRPIMGKFPSYDNLYICAGHFKIGIGFAPMAAGLMTDLILTGQCTPDIREFAPAGSTN